MLHAGTMRDVRCTLATQSHPCPTGSEPIEPDGLFDTFALAARGGTVS